MSDKYRINIDHIEPIATVSELKTIEALGRKIGYGRMMDIVSALWRYDLEHIFHVPTIGAFVPRTSDNLSAEESKLLLYYDKQIEDYKKRS